MTVLVTEGRCVVRRHWLVPRMARDAIVADRGRWSMPEHRLIELEADGMTSTVTVRAINGDVEVRVLGGARSQPRELEKYTVRDGDARETYIHDGRWVECREVAPGG